jgi:hypothetical protein
MQEESIYNDDHSCPDPDNNASDNGDPGRQRGSKEVNSTLVSTSITVDEKKVKKALDQAEGRTVIMKSKTDSKMDKLKRSAAHLWRRSRN